MCQMNGSAPLFAVAPAPGCLHADGNDDYISWHVPDRVLHDLLKHGMQWLGGVSAEHVKRIMPPASLLHSNIYNASSVHVSGLPVGSSSGIIIANIKRLSRMLAKGGSGHHRLLNPALQSSPLARPINWKGEKVMRWMISINSWLLRINPESIGHDRDT